MLEKHITYEASCDFCPESFDTDETGFPQAIGAMKDAGWKVFKRRGEWHHRCPACEENRMGATESDFADLDTFGDDE